MKRLIRLAVLLPVLGAAALGLAAIGRMAQGDTLGDALFHALQVLTISGDYPDSAKWPGNWWIEVARWVGLLFFILTARKAFGLLLSTQWNDLAAQFGRRDLVLVGDHPLLPGLAALLAKRRRVLWLNTGTEQRAAGARVVERTWSPSLVKRYRLGRARAVVVATAGRELEGLAIGRDVLAPGEHDIEVAFLSDLSAGHLALQLRPGADQLRILSPIRLAARAAHDGYPPFAAARRLGHRRIHALFLGGGAAAGEIIADLLMSSATSFLDRPLITVVDPRADEQRLVFDLRMPEIDRVAEFRLVTGPGDQPWPPPIAELRSLTQIDPITVAYVCGDAGRDALQAALAFDDLANREGWDIGWIFFREHDGRATDFGEIAGGRLRPVGTSDQIADSLGLLGGEHRRLARRLHDAYRAGAPAQAPANVPWNALPDHLREANYAGLAHVPAKLESAGVSLASWFAGRRRLDDDASLPAFPDLGEDQSLLMRLAELEHERWMTERLLAGWRHGAARDDRRKIHPDLVPFAQLSEHVRGYDVNVVLTLAAALAGSDRPPGQPAGRAANASRRAASPP